MLASSRNGNQAEDGIADADGLTEQTREHWKGAMVFDAGGPGCAVRGRDSDTAFLVETAHRPPLTRAQCWFEAPTWIEMGFSHRAPLTLRMWAGNLACSQ
jgi:hypothetical protein